MKKLIIAEKPKLAKLIATSIDDDKLISHHGYYEGKKYIITFTFGHMFELFSIEDYIKEQKSWSLSILPFCPDDKNFSFKLIQDKKTKKSNPEIRNQFEIIKLLCNRPDVNEIISCVNCSPESEAFIRLVIRNSILWNSKKLTRLWLPDHTPISVRNGLRKLMPISHYDGLANEGFAKIYTDWLYGINITRYLSIKTGTLLRSNHIMASIIQAIYDREQEIKKYVPKKCYVIRSCETIQDINIEFRSKITFDYNNLLDAFERCGHLNCANAIVTDIEKRNIVIPAPKLYSMTSIQNAANNIYGIPSKECVVILQKLYETGYISYPFTNTEYIDETDKDRISRIIGTFLSHGYPVVFKDDKSIFDSSKVEFYGAIIPTYIIPSSLTGQEKDIYELIRNRFIAVFCSEDCIVNRTDIKIFCYDEEFIISGDTYIKKGFYNFVHNKITENPLPSLNIGDKVDVKFHLLATETTPPGKYTISMFNNFLRNPFSTVLTDETFDDYTDYKAMLDGTEIGTVSSRTDAIKKAIDNKYISCSDKTYSILPLGIYYIETMQRLEIYNLKEKAVDISRGLKDVGKNKKSIENMVDDVLSDIAQMFKFRKQK